MSLDTGGKATSAVPAGKTGTSAVPGAEPDGAPTAWVVSTSAGPLMTSPGDVSDVGERSSLPREKPQATSPAASTTPTVEPILTTRDRRFDWIVCTTPTTLSTRTAR